MPFAVGADWGPGAYAVALTHRPLDVAAQAHAGPRDRRSPGSAIAADAHKLDVAIDAPALDASRASR